MFRIICHNNGSPWWIVNCEGDPARTVVKEHADVFTKEQAETKIKKVIKENPHRNLKGRLHLEKVCLP